MLSIILTIFLSLATSTIADNSWKFDSQTDVKTKGDAIKLAKQTGVGFDKNGKENPTKLKSMFENWQREFNVNFQSQQAEAKALQAFKTNMKQIADININPNIPYWSSGNQFSHLSYDEFASTILMRVNRFNRKTRSPSPSPSLSPSVTPSPSPSPTNFVDWVIAGKVTPIKNQGSCGSCWAFAASSVLESYHLIKTNTTYNPTNPVDLSEQQIVSCETISFGCNGGWSDTAIDYVARTGLSSESTWPYTATTSTCQQSNLKPILTNTPLHIDITPYRIPALKQALQTSPTVFYFMADSTFQNYRGGIYTPTTCTNNINHAMVIVGYEDPTPTTTSPYWRIKNSWGTSWGEQGYARIQMMGDNTPGRCGMYQYNMQVPV